MSATISDRAERLAALVRMADAKAAEMSEGQIRSYLDLLEDVPTPLLQAACVRLAKAATFGLPSVGDIRAIADEIQIAAAEHRALNAERAIESAKADEDRRNWFHCLLCRDDEGAWQLLFCPGAGPARDDAAFSREAVLQSLNVQQKSCGDMAPHRPHTYVRRCECHHAPWREERRKRIERYGEDLRTQRRSA